MSEVVMEIQRLLHWWHNCPVAPYFEAEFDQRLNELLDMEAEQSLNNEKL